MNNIYQTQLVKIVDVKDESIDTKLFRLQFVDKKIQSSFDFLPGQFMQVGLSGWGECPISMASSPIDSRKFFELAIRNVGTLTDRLHQLKKGDIIDVRGPFGNGFDIEKFKDKPLILVGGGCGFIPLRPLVVDALKGILGNTVLQIFYGCQNENTLLFKSEYVGWNRQAELNVVLEKPTKKWAGKTGMVTDAIKDAKILAESVTILVGPPIMYKFVIEELKKKKIKEENIFVSLERKMYCGVGVCQHCAIGPYYVCKDGPVFCYKDIKDIKGIL